MREKEVTLHRPGKGSSGRTLLWSSCTWREGVIGRGDNSHNYLEIGSRLVTFAWLELQLCCKENVLADLNTKRLIEPNWRPVLFAGSTTKLLHCLSVWQNTFWEFTAQPIICFSTVSCCQKTTCRFSHAPARNKWRRSVPTTRNGHRHYTLVWSVKDCSNSRLTR